MFLQSLFALLTIAANGSPRIAVMPLSARSVASGDVEMVTDILAGQLTAKSGLRVMERSEMKRILHEQGFQESGACDGQQCAVEVGRILGLDEMVVGSFGRLGDSWALALRRVSVETGEILGQSTRQYVGPLSNVPDHLVAPAVADLATPSGTAPVLASPFEATRRPPSGMRVRSVDSTDTTRSYIGTERLDSTDSAGTAQTVQVSPEELRRGEIIRGVGIVGLVGGGAAAIFALAQLSNKNSDSSFVLHGADRENWNRAGLGGLVVAAVGTIAMIAGQNIIESAQSTRKAPLSLEPVQGLGASGTASGIALSARF